MATTAGVRSEHTKHCPQKLKDPQELPGQPASYEEVVSAELDDLTDTQGWSAA